MTSKKLPTHAPQETTKPTRKRRTPGALERVTAGVVDSRPPHLTAVVYLRPASTTVTPGELAVSMAELLAEFENLTSADVNVSGAGGRATAYARCAGDLRELLSKDIQGVAP